MIPANRKRPLYCIAIVGGSLLAASALLSAQSSKKPVPILYVWNGGDSGIVVGASQGGTWLTWEKTHNRIKGGERYQLYSATGGAGTAVGKKPELSEASGSAYNLALSGLPPKRTSFVALNGATWKPQPRLPKALSPQSETYRTAVTDFLKQKGLADPKAEIAKIWQADLEGDGIEEVLIEAHSPGFPETVSEAKQPKAGAFSIVLLRRRAQDGTVKTLTIGADIYAKAREDATPNRYTLSHLLDLNGDGRMEVVVEWSYYEGAGVNVVELKNGQVKTVLEASDGA